MTHVASGMVVFCKFVEKHPMCRYFVGTDMFPILGYFRTLPSYFSFFFFGQLLHKNEEKLQQPLPLQISYQFY